MLSLRNRLLLAATLVLAAFLGLTGFALDRAFQSSAEAGLRDALQAQIYGLLAAGDLDDAGQLVIPDALPESRFGSPGSGLYGLVANNDGGVVWRSQSSVGRAIADDVVLPPGSSRFGEEQDGVENTLYALRFAVSWQDIDGNASDFTITVAEDRRRLIAQVETFRRNLWLWLGAAALVLVAVQGTILRWGLAPLTAIADELADVEAGRKAALTETYPKELQGLAYNINTFIRNERENLDRHRNTLGDLAHSLKTPLAVLRSLFESDVDAKSTSAQEQIDRMTGIVDYQLRRAATSGKSTLLTPVSVHDTVDKVLASLQKVYADKSVTVDIDVPEQLQFFGERGDLFEILGNLLDNAFKLCRYRVAISGRVAGNVHQRRPGVCLSISDDGPGVPEQMINEITARGVRASKQSPGQGIGLAVVTDIVASYGGRLAIANREAGGTVFTITIDPTSIAGADNSPRMRS
ncbi:MAG: ATP-binding protein [Gammaproteobacteria bacterium]|nr:ATP-binding protein [Gammaproteobacteria bacterium]